jgi:hypothetical protein
VEYKLTGNGYMYDLYCDEAGQIYHYLANGDRCDLEQRESMREVSAQEYDKDTKYMSVKLQYKNGGYSPAADVAELIARSAFGIGETPYGYARLKRKGIKNLELKNIEFVQRNVYTGDPISITDRHGSIPYNMYTKDANSIDKPNMATITGQHSMPIPGKRTQTDSVKMDLGDRDRSVVAELLYTLITEKEISVADTLKVLCVSGDYEILELYLEGKDIIGERVAEEMAKKRDQERDRNYVKTTKLYKNKPIFLGASTGRSYIRVDDEYKLL